MDFAEVRVDALRVDNMQRPAEAELLDEALKRCQPRLSARKAAKLAGISEGWWRQITKGFQTRGTGSIPVVAPAETIARMALAVGVSKEELEKVGRGDAAEILPAIREQQSAIDLTAVSDDELLAEIRHRMGGQRNALETTAQSNVPSQAGQTQKSSDNPPKRSPIPKHRDPKKKSARADGSE